MRGSGYLRLSPTQAAIRDSFLSIGDLSPQPRVNLLFGGGAKVALY